MSYDDDSDSTVDLEMGGVLPEYEDDAPEYDEDSEAEEEEQDPIPIPVIAGGICVLLLLAFFWYFYLIREDPTVVAARAAKKMSATRGVTIKQPAEKKAPAEASKQETEGSQSGEHEDSQHDPGEGGGSLLDTITENPLQTAGAAVLGAAGIYGTYKLGKRFMNRRKTGPLGKVGDKVGQWTNDKMCGNGQFQLSPKSCKKVKETSGKVFDVTSKGTRHIRRYLAMFYNTIGWVLAKPFTLVNALIKGKKHDICTPENEKHLGWAALIAGSFALEDPYRKLNNSVYKFLRINPEEDKWWKYYPLKGVEYIVKAVTLPLWVIGLASSPTKSFIGKVANATLPEEKFANGKVEHAEFKAKAERLKKLNFPIKIPDKDGDFLEKSFVEQLLKTAIEKNVKLNKLDEKENIYVIHIPEDLKNYTGPAPKADKEASKPAGNNNSPTGTTPPTRGSTRTPGPAVPPVSPNRRNRRSGRRGPR